MLPTAEQTGKQATAVAPITGAATMAPVDSAPATVHVRPHSGERQNAAGYIPALDGVRGLAMIFVLFCHWSQSILSVPIHGYINDMAHTMAFVGHTGLDIFFVLSGFLITRILIGLKATPSRVFNFLVRRGLKIFPLYYLVVLSVLLFVPAAIRHTQLRMDVHDTALWTLLVYGQNIADVVHRSFLFGALDHFWSLSVEEHFYWLWPLAIIFLSRRNAVFACLGLLFLAFGSRCWFYFQGHDAFALELLTPCRLDGLACGALLALAESAGLLTKRITIPLAVGFTVFLAASIGVHHNFWGEWGTVLLKTFESLAFCAAIALTIIYRNGFLGRFFANPVFTFFGVYSYGIYAYHHIFRPPLLPVTILYSAAKPNNAAVSYGLVHLAISIAIAYVSYHIFEKHFLKLKSRFPDIDRAPAAKPETSV